MKEVCSNIGLETHDRFMDPLTNQMNKENLYQIYDSEKKNNQLKYNFDILNDVMNKIQIESINQIKHENYNYNYNSNAPVIIKKDDGLIENKNYNNPEHYDYETIVHTKNWLYKYIRRNDFNQVCSICLEDKEIGDNIILKCHDCGNNIHKNCYIKTPKMNKSKSTFKCIKCMETKYKQKTKITTDFSCRYCPNDEGILIKLKNNKWSHISCIKWIFNIQPSDIRTTTDFDLKIPNWRLLNKCGMCNITSTSGKYCVLKCAYDSCYFYMHVNCAVNYNCIFRDSDMEKYLRPLFENNLLIRPYCPEHLQFFLELNECKLKNDVFDTQIEFTSQSQPKYYTLSTTTVDTLSSNSTKEDLNIKSKRYVSVYEFKQAQNSMIKFLNDDIKLINKKRKSRLHSKINSQSLFQLFEINSLITKYYMNKVKNWESNRVYIDLDKEDPNEVDCILLDDD